MMIYRHRPPVDRRAVAPVRKSSASGVGAATSAKTVAPAKAGASGGVRDLLPDTLGFVDRVQQLNWMNRQLQQALGAPTVLMPKD